MSGPSSASQPPASAEPGASPRPKTEPGAGRARVGAHVWRGLALFVVGGVATFLLMANEGQIRQGPLWGTLTMLVCAAGLLEALGLLRARSEDDGVPLARTALGRLEREPVWATPRVALPAAIALVFLGGPALGYERLPYVLVAALLVLLAPAIRRPGWLVFVVGGAIMLPALGVYGLWDPWETHYGEVAREILSRDDWISLWWAQEDWFWSKPILIFWANALSMGYLGVDFRPDANPSHPEWALRLPVFVVCMVALLAVYAAIARVYGKRAGVLAALVLATMPHFFFLSHQAITDPYFVGTMTTAMAFLVIAIAEPPAREVTFYRIAGRHGVSAQGLLLGLVLMLVLPQILYLASRNITLMPGGFALHGDQFVFGSAGNSHVPGNKPAHDVTPYLAAPVFQPLAQALLYAAGLPFMVWMLRRDRTARGLAMTGFYVFCALAFMAKGIPGFALPGLVALLFLLATGRWSLLLEGHLRVARGVLTIVLVGMPWYVAMYIRHGPAFTDRLLVHDHLNRLASGVHGDNGAIDYFLLQLGVAMFPWVALVPAALAGFAEAATAAVGRARDWLAGAASAGGPTRDDDAGSGAAPAAQRSPAVQASPTGASARDRAVRDALLGGVVLLAGIVVAAMTARSPASGRVFTLAWCAAIAGGLQLSRGLIALGGGAHGGVAAAGVGLGGVAAAGVAVRGGADGGSVVDPAPAGGSGDDSGAAARAEGAGTGGGDGTAARGRDAASAGAGPDMASEDAARPADAGRGASLPSTAGSDAASQGAAGSDAASENARGDVAQLLVLWFTAAFVLFSAMITKFHHYIFPAVPPAAILVGLLLDRLLGADVGALPFGRRLLGTALSVLAPLPLVLGVAGLFGDPRGAMDFDAVPAAERQRWVLEHGWPVAVCVALLGLGLGMLAAAYVVFTRGRAATDPGSTGPVAPGAAPGTAATLGASAALAAAPLLVAFVARDLAWVTATRPAGYERLIHLFVYNYSRPWPDVFDYRPILTGFGVVVTVLFALAVLRRLRPLALRATLGLAVLFAAWGLDVYLVDLSPHWAQGHVIRKYYELRRSPDEPLVAWQMNWKGENFYTGNRVSVFVDLDNTKLRQWIERNRGKRAFVALEHSRLQNFRNLVAPREVREITGPRDNNKFLLVQVDL
jgi:4-amino-4-deoxy-L-arabinose transferase-like glycosyltransferase